jgi:integrase
MPTRRKVKLETVSLSPVLSPATDRTAHAFAIVGQAFLKAAEVLQGKSAGGQTLPPGLSLDSGCGRTVIELVNEFLLAKARAGRSDRYLRQLRVSLGNFKMGRGRKSIVEVTAVELERWIQSQNWAPKTARNYLADVGVLYNFAKRRGYVDRNPAAGVELPVIDSGGTIHVHTPDQVRKVLEALRRADLDVCRRVAVRYFAGVRSAEANRLTEADLKLEQGFLEVPAVKSKTRARRLVTIQPNLAAWLALGGELRGMSDTTVREKLALAKVEWSHNVTRHSFVSYHLAAFNNAGRTALEAGHSETMLFKHYRALVTPAAAKEFWEIRP